MRSRLCRPLATSSGAEGGSHWPVAATPASSSSPCLRAGTIDVTFAVKAGDGYEAFERGRPRHADLRRRHRAWLRELGRPPPDVPGLGVVSGTLDGAEQLIREAVPFHIDGPHEAGRIGPRAVSRGLRAPPSHRRVATPDRGRRANPSPNPLQNPLPGVVGSHRILPANAHAGPGAGRATFRDRYVAVAIVGPATSS